MSSVSESSPGWFSTLDRTFSGVGPDHRSGGGAPEFVLRAGSQDFGGSRGQAGGRAVPAQPIRHGNAFHRDTSPLWHWQAACQTDAFDHLGT